MTIAIGTVVFATPPNGGTATFTQAASITLGAGDSLLVLGTGSTNSSAVLSVSGGGLTYTAIGSALVDTASHDQLAAWYVQTPGAGSYTVTVALSNTPASPYIGIALVQITGGATSGILVASGPGQFQTAPGTTTDAVTSGTAQTPSGYPALVVGFCSDDDVNSTPAAGTGFTSAGTGWAWELGLNGARVESKRITSGTAQATFTAGTGTDHFLTNLFVFLEGSAGPTGTIISSQPPTMPAAPMPQLVKGAGQAAQVAQVLSAVEPARRPQDLPPGPRLAAGFGQAAQVAVIARPSDVAPRAVEAPQLPRVFAGVVPVVAAAAGTILAARQLPTVVDSVGPALVTGIYPDDPAVIITTALQASGAELPPRGFVSAGFGQAAQKAAILQSPTTYAPESVKPSFFAGVAPQATPSATILAPHRSAPPVALPPAPAVFAGFGLAAQKPVVVQDPWFATATFDPVLAPPLPALFAGFGQPAQKATTTQPAIVQQAQLPPQPSSFVGVVPPATTSGVILSTPAARQADLALRPMIFSGFGQPAQNAVIVVAPLAPPEAKLPPQAILAAGFGQAAQVATVTQASDARSPVPFAQPLLFAGFGQAAQAAQVIVAPAVAPRADLFLLPRLIAGAGLPAPLPVPIIYAPTPFAPRVELPPAPSLRAGAGQAAQAPVILSAVSSAPSVDLFITARLFAGFGQPAPLPPPIVYSAPQSAPSAQLPPLPLAIKGSGQAAQVAVVYSAARVPELAALPPAIFLAAGVVPPPIGVAALVRALSVDTAALPPRPTLTRGFGQAAQNATVLAPLLVPPSADLPPQPGAFAGVPIQPIGTILRSAPPREAHLPPEPQLMAGFGFPSQVGVIITIPFGTADVTKLPPQAMIVVGFGNPAPLFIPASRPGRKIAGSFYNPRRRRV